MLVLNVISAPYYFLSTKFAFKYGLLGVLFASSLHRRIPFYSELSAGADAEAVELEPADAAAGGSHAPARGGGFAAFTTRSQQARLFLPLSTSVPDP